MFDSPKEAKLSPDSLTMIDRMGERTLNITNSRIYSHQYNIPISQLDYVQQKYVDDKIYLLRHITPTPPVTGTTAETLVYTWFIPANTFSTEDWFRIEDLTVLSNTNVLANAIIRIRFNNTNTLDSSITKLLAVNTLASGGLAGNSRYNKLERNFDIFNGNIAGLSNIVGASTDKTTNTYTINPFNPSVDNWLFVTIQLTNVSDSIYMKNLIIKK
jgi:hypothetical protein